MKKWNDNIFFTTMNDTLRQRIGNCEMFRIDFNYNGKSTTIANVEFSCSYKTENCDCVPETYSVYGKCRHKKYNVEDDLFFAITENDVMHLLEVVLQCNNLKRMEISGDFCCTDGHGQCGIIRKFLLLQKSWIVNLLKFHNVKEECLDNIFEMIPPDECKYPVHFQIGFDEPYDTGVTFDFYQNFFRENRVETLLLRNVPDEDSLVHFQIWLFCSTSKLKTLELSGNVDGRNIGDDDEFDEQNHKTIQNVAENVPQNLETLSINFNNLLLKNIYMEVLFEDLCLKHVPLLNLNFGTSYLSKKSIESLSSYLLSEQCILTDLTIIKEDQCRFYCKSRILAETICRNSTVTKLVLHGNVTNNQMWIDAFASNTVLQTVDMSYAMVSEQFFISVFEKNYTLLQLYDCETFVTKKFDPAFINVDNLKKNLKRNASIRWTQSMHESIVNYVIVMAPICLPSYVLLWIFDFLPHMSHVKHFRKIQLMQNVVGSIRKIYQKRLVSNKV